MSQHQESIAGLATAWAATIASWINALVGGIPIDAQSLLAYVPTILTCVLTLTTIIWTIERTRTERAKRKAIEGYADTQPGAIKRLMKRIDTKRGEL